MIDNNSEKRTLEPIIDDDTKRRLWDEAQKATPDHVLETQLHDSRIPKPEIVHYASRKIKALEEEIERLRKCCTQRGARMQIMRDWMDEPRGLHTPGLWPPTEWYYFTQDRPEAEKWFDDDGVPVDATAREGE